ncbi:MAG: right-handed parallel beta-helix repeat-containing protein [Acidobacteriaceae bacterium]
MKTRIGIAVLFVAATAVTARSSSAQANVSENEPASIYVDASQGSDSNPGTVSQPLKTVSAGEQKAMANVAQGIGTRVMINPGIYREYVKVTPRGRTGAPVTFQATQTGTAIIAGSDVMTGWAGSGSGVYSHSWPYQFGCSTPSGLPSGTTSIALRQEMVFINGALLTQVLSRWAMQAGTFYVDTGRKQVYIWQANGADPNQSTVEVSARVHTMDVDSVPNLVIRGLVFRHGAPCINDDSVNVNSSSNVLIDSSDFEWNNFGGFGFHGSSNLTLQNSVAAHNGGNGLQSWKNKNVLVQFVESDYNNWRGAMGNMYDYGMGGFKFMMTHGATVTQYFAYDNQAQGLWFDTDNKNITVQNATLIGNKVANLQVELNIGPVSVANSTLCYGDVGVNLINSTYLTLTGNTLYGNGGSTVHTQPQFYLEGKQGGRHFNDWETGQYYNVISSNVSFSNNVFEDAGSRQYVFGTYMMGSDWTPFASTLRSNNNSWYDAATPAAFAMPGKHMDLAGWRGATGQDSASVWSAPSTVAKICAVPAPSVADFHLSAEGKSYATSRGQATIGLTVKPLGTSTVSLKTGDLPSGVTASIGGSVTTGGHPTITVKASPKAASQIVPLTVYARSGGQLHTVTVNVAINPGS